jgi:AcrR family transcriptional regulator
MDGSVANMRRLGPPRTGIAERIWNAARLEFSRRGYHGARVQGIARGAACNVALIYRHWSSKKALYLDILRSVWLEAAADIAEVVEHGSGGTSAVVEAYLDAMLRDQMGAQLLIREYLDGAPHLAQLAGDDPSLLEPVRRAAAAIALADGRESGIDPVLAVVTIGGLAALLASAQEASRPFVETPLAAETWRRHVHEVLLHGLAPGQRRPSTSGPGASVST